MRVLKDFSYFILSIQEKILTCRLKKTLEIKPSAKRKQYYLSGCSLNLESLAESERIKMEEELALILKASNYNPHEVLKYVEKHGTEVFYLDNLKLINSVGISEGFVYPLKGFKAMYISSIVKKKLDLKTNEMFILGLGDINTYYFMYHFYNWYAYKHGVNGIDIESMELLDKYLQDNDENLSSLQLSDIYKLNEAIRQDKAAIDFVINLCRKQEASQNALKKIKDTGANL